jgi:hypothetical protein
MGKNYQLSTIWTSDEFAVALRELIAGQGWYCDVKPGWPKFGDHAALADQAIMLYAASRLQPKIGPEERVGTLRSWLKGESVPHPADNLFTCLLFVCSNLRQDELARSEWGKAALRASVRATRTRLGELLDELDEIDPYAAATERRKLLTSPPKRADTPERSLTFLCHSSGDKASIHDLYRRLQSSGVTCWLDEEDLVAGQDFDLEIRRAIAGSRFIVVGLSQSSTNKVGYLQKELRFALDRADEQPEGSIYLLPVRLEPCEIPDRLSHLHAVDLFEPAGFNRLLRALRHAQTAT